MEAVRYRRIDGMSVDNVEHCIGRMKLNEERAPTKNPRRKPGSDGTIYGLQKALGETGVRS